MNTNWPIEVTILDETCNIAGPYGIYTEDYPNTINDWVKYEFIKVNPTPHLAMLDWWTAHERLDKAIFKLRRENDGAINALLMLQSEPHLASPLLLTGKTLYNVTWAYFGYIDGQEQYIIDISNYVRQHSIFQKLLESPPEIPIFVRPEKRAKEKVPQKPPPIIRNKYSIPSKK